MLMAMVYMTAAVVLLARTRTVMASRICSIKIPTEMVFRILLKAQWIVTETVFWIISIWTATTTASLTVQKRRRVV